MSVFDALNDTTDKATDIGERYLKTSHHYLKLKIFQQLTLSISLLTKVMLIGGLLLVGLIFCSIALALKFGEMLDSLASGCVLVGAIYLVLAIIIFMLRSKINTLVIKKIGINFFK